MMMSADFVHLKNMQMLVAEASNWNQIGIKECIHFNVDPTLQLLNRAIIISL